eukprot:341624-Pelagomonas_calceolata.AAC.2
MPAQCSLFLQRGPSGVLNPLTPGGLARALPTARPEHVQVWCLPVHGAIASSPMQLRLHFCSRCRHCPRSFACTKLLTSLLSAKPLVRA